MTTVMVGIEQLEKRYSGAATPALRGLTMSVASAEFMGILGPNGAGKTTLLSILCGLRRPTGGTVRVGGHDVTRESAAVRRLIGFVPQNVALYPRLTARENLVFFARMYGLRGAELRDRVAECLVMAGLEQYADRQIRTFSGGMTRRANLVAGLVHRPPLLILDEPTVGIDAQSRNMILESLQRLNKAGTTILYATHYMEEAEQICSDVAILDDGLLLRRGAPGALIRQEPGCGNLGELYLHLTGRSMRDE